MKNSPKPNLVVIKVGTSTLTRGKEEIDRGYLSFLAKEISALKKEGVQVVLVTSGAIRAGISRLGLSENLSLPLQQAAASVGQGSLMQLYEESFAPFGIIVGQVLLTHEDLAERKRFLNARNTLLTLLKWGVVPIVNENDTVAVEEIKFGDNDILAGMVSSALSADLLLLLSDVDGLLNEKGEVIPLVEDISSVYPLAGEAGRMGRGGMRSKLEAARIATSAGVEVVIANGQEEEVIQRIVLKGERIGTRFPPKRRMEARKRWLAFISRPKGRIMVNEGAREAIVEHGKSLLPVGVVGVEGRFQQGDVVRIICGGEEFARGLTNYSGEELEMIKGHHTSELESLLGYKGPEEVIHRDNLAVLEEKFLRKEA